ncbi:hypothetical protein AVEN_66325-1 [Araneus ventricosus]|uniref:Uncharacterized protein n=1 Tax=Araneus ventricosus TaxID=182803 RepID=A0A4Y2XC52_ARAVE|nr:hypothetical protein AVEN_66325-1 [Araneus ventricosus]
MKQFPVGMLDPWINAVVSIPVHVHPDQATCFQSSTVQWRRWRAQTRRKTVCRTVNNDTRVGHRFRKPISMMVRSTVRTLTFLNAPALKSAAI